MLGKEPYQGRGIRAVIQTVDELDRALDDRLRNRPCGMGGAVAEFGL